MNQILSVEPVKSKNNKASINTIVLVFCVILIIFGIGITSTGAYSYYKNISNNLDSNVATSNTKPNITIDRESTNLVNIVVTHDKEISKVSYKINNDEPTEETLEGETSFEREIELPSGKSNVIVTATDINGITATYDSDFEVEQKPKITLEQAESQIKATIESDINIEYIEYYWDDNEEEAQKYEINDVKTETLIDVPEGQHVLTVKAFDINGGEDSKTQKIIGDNKPLLKITTDGEKFIIEASDDQGLSKIQMKLNSNDIQEEDISGQEYRTEIPLEQGSNKITVRVFNQNGISETSKAKFTKE